MSDIRHEVGAAGERLAAAFLTRHGLDVIARNVEIDGGEVDLLAMDAGQRVVVEVRSITGPGEPQDAYGAEKAAQVGRLARLLRAHRVDLVAIRFGDDAAEFRWIRGAT